MKEKRETYGSEGGNSLTRTISIWVVFLHI